MMMMMTMLMSKVPTKKRRVKMKKMTAIRLMISSPRVKIWKWRLKNSHCRIPSKGFYVEFMRHNKHDHTNELMFLLDEMLRLGAINLPPNIRNLMKPAVDYIMQHDKE